MKKQETNPVGTAASTTYHVIFRNLEVYFIDIKRPGVWPMLNTLDDVSVIDLKTIPDETGSLLVIEKGDSVTIDIKRLFLVSDVKGADRGNHSHKECSQILICISGACEVTCDDGVNRKRVLLQDSGMGLYIPPSIWASQKYLEEGTRLLVLCDQLYDENDYIRNYMHFQNYRKISTVIAVTQ